MVLTRYRVSSNTLIIILYFDIYTACHQEFSSRALVTIVPIMLLLLGPLFLVLVCVGYRIFIKTKKAQAVNRSQGLSRRHSRQSRDGALVQTAGDEELQQQPDDERTDAVVGGSHQRETEIN